MKKEIQTTKAQSAVSLLSQAIETRDTIFTSGFIHMDADGNMVDGTPTEKFTQVMQNVKETLAAAGVSLRNVVKVTLYVTNMQDLKEINELYVTYFEDQKPAREAIGVQELPLGATIEMSVVATK